MSQIKERPILFSAPMVRAILEGRKTVTRRAVKASKAHADGITLIDYGKGWWPYNAFGDFSSDHEGMEYPIACPHGKPGERLWVRETWSDVNLQGAPGIAYRADGDVRDLMEDASFLDEGGAFNYDDPRSKPYNFACWSEDLLGGKEGRWRPSIHIPRWASRILLEITAVRVERLQDISEEQAQAEGCFFTDYGRKCGHTGIGWTEVGDCAAPEEHHPQRNGWMWDKTSSPNECLGTATLAFANLWQKTGGDWEANAWVWVVEFKRVTP